MANGNSGPTNNSSIVAIVAIVLLVGLAALLLLYVLPSLKNQPTNQPEGVNAHLLLPINGGSQPPSSSGPNNY